MANIWRISLGTGSVSMHIRVHIGDKSGKILLNSVMGKIIQGSTGHSYKVHCHPGEGHIPKKETKSPKPNKQGLLNRLPNIVERVG